MMSVFRSTASMLLMHSTVPSRTQILYNLYFQTRNSRFRSLSSRPYILRHDANSPLFVTWNTLSSRPGRQPRLRGCIGNFDPMPIVDGLAEYALISAFRDSRFRKISKNELETLECGYVL